MCDEKHRYFIEVQGLSEALDLRHDYEARRTQALEIISRLKNWLHDQGLEERVSTLSPTVFGQVQITCPEDVMNKIRDEEPLPIATIRQGSLISWSLAHAS